MTSVGSVVLALTRRRHTVTGQLFLVLLWDTLTVLEWDIAEQNVNLLWADKVITIEVVPETSKSDQKLDHKFKLNKRPLLLILRFQAKEVRLTS